MYWLSHRYPGVPFVKIDVQELHVLAREPQILDNALSSPDLALVALSKAGPGVVDGRLEPGRELWQRVRAQVESRFVRSTEFPKPYSFWVRR